MSPPAYIIAALLLASGAAPAFSQRHETAVPGAIAGRSPQQAYRSTTAQDGCRTAMHSLPGGKLPVFGRSTAPSADCVAPELASASPADAPALSRE